MAHAALYYPYIHFRNEGWLKRALLIFPQMYRMVPPHLATHDTPFVNQLRDLGLVSMARLSTPGVDGALEALATRISADVRSDRDFRMRYGKEPADALKVPGQAGYQIHWGKAPGLMNMLRRERLAWHPEIADGHEYFELHPVIGATVMSTLAAACAVDAGLSIVTDEGKLHDVLVQNAEDQIYEAMIGRKARPPVGKRKARAEQLAEFLVYQRCNVDGLTAPNIAKLRQEREPLDRLRSELKKIADAMPEMRDREAFEDELRAEVDDVLRRWTNDKANLSKFAKRVFFGSGEPTAKFVQKLAELAAGPVAGAGAGAAAAGKEVIVGGMTTGALVGAAAGTAVALIVHVARSAAAVVKEAQASPFRFLTLAEKHGAAFTLGETVASSRKGRR